MSSLVHSPAKEPYCINMTTIIITIGMVVIALLNGCYTGESEHAGDPATLEVREAVISAWEQVFDTEVSVYGRNDLADIPVITLPAAEFHVRFPGLSGKNVDDTIYLPDDLSSTLRPLVLSHEYEHSLAGFMLGEFVNCHENPKVYSCPGSVEKVAFAIIGNTNTTSSYKCGVSSCRAK